MIVFFRPGRKPTPLKITSNWLYVLFNGLTASEPIKKMRRGGKNMKNLYNRDYISRTNYGNSKRKRSFYGNKYPMSSIRSNKYYTNKYTNSHNETFGFYDGSV